MLSDDAKTVAAVWFYGWTSGTAYKKTGPLGKGRLRSALVELYQQNLISLVNEPGPTWLVSPNVPFQDEFDWYIDNKDHLEWRPGAL